MSDKSDNRKVSRILYRTLSGFGVMLVLIWRAACGKN